MSTTTKFYHLLAIAGWLLNIAGALFVPTVDLGDFLKGLGLGVVLMSYLTIIINNKKKKNEVASR
jgi:hypothetical protein